MSDASVSSPPRKPDPTIAILIPAYRPGEALIDVCAGLCAGNWKVIAVVDDGSGPEYASVFREIVKLPNVEVIPHAVNLGKGSALRTGINTILCANPDIAGIITADADGQHDPSDVLRVGARFQKSPESLVLGVRDFEGPVPLRSRIGNAITRSVMRVLVGQRLSDSQTGLRAIPRALLERLLKISSPGYEFELEMLLAVKHLGLSVVEQPIRTIYEPGNPSSHFHPIRDSMRIYFVLLRFALIGAATAVLDNVVFSSVYGLAGSILEAQIVGRIVAVIFNYSAVRKAVFLSERPHRELLPRYLCIVAANAAISYVSIRLLLNLFQMNVLTAKVIAEAVLFIANFILQRDFVFTKRQPETPRATDWDRYYKSVPWTAHLTRKYTQSVLISAIRRFKNATGDLGTIVEIGGANSCFIEAILANLNPRIYHVIDSNDYGLALLMERMGRRENVLLHKGDVLRLPDLNAQSDVVFSIGLVEHFDVAGTREAIRAHFALLQSGGCAIISFPTPTWLYIGTRAIAQLLGVWRFPDERPLRRDEVLETVTELGEIVFESTLWPLVLTQHLMVVRKL